MAFAVSGTADALNAIVVATAVRHQAPIVTSDPNDLTHIANSIGVKSISTPPDGNVRLSADEPKLLSA